MIYRYRLLFVLMLMAVAVFPAAISAESPAGVNNLITAPEDLSFQLSIPTVTIDADGVITAPGLDGHLSESGAPALPFYSTLIALPPTGKYSVEVETGMTAIRSAEIRAYPDIINHDLLVDGQLVRSLEDEIGLTYEYTPEILSADTLYPEVRYEVSAPMQWRDLRVVQLKLYPLRYNATTQLLSHTKSFDISVQFDQADASDMRQAPHVDTAFNQNDALLNPAQASNWHALVAPNVAPSTFPLNTPTYKIEVNEAGIYHLTYSQLQSAGMNVGSINPNTFEMMHNGQPVAYQVIGDGDNQFELNEAIRFYGWGFDGSRHDRQYVTNNIFWIWANGTPSNVPTIANATGMTPVTSWPSTVTLEENDLWSATYTSKWSTFDNEADTWYMDTLTLNSPKIFNIDLPHPAPTGPDATFLAELLSQYNYFDHRVHVTLNTQTATRVWDRVFNVNIEGQIPQADLNAGANSFTLLSDTVGSSSSPVTAEYFLINRLEVAYQRQFVADNDQLIFDYPTAGAHQFNVSGFANGTSGAAVVWDVSNREQPTSISLGAADVTGNGSYSYRIGRNHSADAQIIVTTENNIQTPVAISEYTASSIDPITGGAHWIAIAHDSLMAETERLAQHRSTFSGLDTVVVDVEDVYNQYGYGFKVPSAIQDYTRHAISDWVIKPSYLLLAGDATQNPSQNPCSFCSSDISSEETLVVTDLLAVDRFLGLAPSDHTFAAIIGNDDLPDIVVGRYAASNSAEMANVVDKVILYDTATAADAAWTKNILFAADNVDTGGNFCAENSLIASSYLPAGFNDTAYCLDPYITNAAGNQATAASNMHVDLFGDLNSNGAGILNYRGHGSITNWASGLLDRSHASSWQNTGKPTIILSADCLDGHFAWPNNPALSETFLMQGGNTGTAGHWSSSGLGYSFEHTAMHSQLYLGLYTQDLTTLGDASNYAKTKFIIGNSGSLSEVYTFNLQADPALGVAAPTPNDYTVTNTSAQAQTTAAGTTVNYTVNIENTGNSAEGYDLSLASSRWASSVSPASIAPLAPGQSAVATVSVTIPASAIGADVDVTTLQIVPSSTTLDPAGNYLVTGDSTFERFTTTAAVANAAVSTPTAQSSMGSSGQTVSYNITVTNSGNTYEAFTLAQSGGSWAATATTTPVLAPGQSATVTVVVSIPAGAAGGSSETTSFNVVHTSDTTTALATTQMNTTVQNVFAATVTPANQTGVAMAGQTVSYNVTVTNNGNTSEAFKLSQTGGWPATATTTGQLAQGQSGTITINVTIPANAAGGLVDAETFNVEPISNSSVVVGSIQTMTSTQTPLATAAAVSPASQSAAGYVGTALSYTVGITNVGGTSEAFTLAQTNGSWTYSVSSTPNLAPGQVGSITITVQVPGNVAAGDVDLSQFDVVAASDPSTSLATVAFNTQAKFFALHLPILQR